MNANSTKRMDGGDICMSDLKLKLPGCLSLHSEKYKTHQFGQKKVENLLM